MKYVILTAKHHEGFCLWDSKYTEYDVASSGNPTNVIEAIAKSCKKYDIGLGLYYSLWDRKVNADVKDPSKDAAYNEYMLRQLNELIDIVEPYTNIVEFWFDGGWEKENYRWPVKDIYQTIKSRQPDCQIGINWTIGLPENPDAHPVLPENQKEGYPIRYFPSDFRLGDPYLPRPIMIRKFLPTTVKNIICLGNLPSVSANVGFIIRPTKSINRLMSWQNCTVSVQRMIIS